MPLTLKLNELMLRKGITKEMLEERLAIEPQKISILLEGKARAFKTNTLVMLCQLFDCKPGDLLDYEYDAADPKSYAELKDELGKQDNSWFGKKGLFGFFKPATSK